MLSFDRQRGTLFGLAIGDALGAAVVKMPGTIDKVTGYRDDGTHGLASTLPLTRHTILPEGPAY